jgi:hypothetical protein
MSDESAQKVFSQNYLKLLNLGIRERALLESLQEVKAQMYALVYPEQTTKVPSDFDVLRAQSEKVQEREEG